MNLNLRVGVLTLGCKVNSYDSEAMTEILIKDGFKMVDFNDMADVYIINTCAVTDLASKKSRQMIRQARKRNPDSIICAAGCMTQVNDKNMLDMKEVDIFLGTQDRKDISLCIQQAITTGKIVAVTDNRKNTVFEPLEIHNFSGRHRAFIKVQEGCEQFCSYCVIPLARGPIKSRDMKSIIDEIERLVKAGFEEIILTGIHIASFGKDKKEGLQYSDGLIELIQAVEETNIKRVRISSISPLAVTDNFLYALQKTKKLCHQFHLSLQSGSSTILKRMNRRYDSEFYKEKVTLLREVWPDTMLTTDIIVGFPEETDSEFLETVEVVKDISFLDVHIFPYSKKDKTKASLLKQVPNEIKKQRVARLTDVANNERIKNLKSMIDKEYDMLIEQDVSIYSTGYTELYAPVLVAQTNLRGIQKVNISDIIEQDTLLYLEGTIK